jgi:hypothetical protein
MSSHSEFYTNKCSEFLEWVSLPNEDDIIEDYDEFLQYHYNELDDFIANYFELDELNKFISEFGIGKALQEVISNYGAEMLADNPRIENLLAYTILQYEVTPDESWEKYKHEADTVKRTE